jgi:hypothetical protein
MEASEFTTPEQDHADQRAYEAELVRRLQMGLPMSRADKRDAQRLCRLQDLADGLDRWDAASLRGGSVGGAYNDIKTAATALGYKPVRDGYMWAWARKQLGRPE